MIHKVVKCTVRVRLGGFLEPNAGGADSCTGLRGGFLWASASQTQLSFIVNQVVLFPPGYLDFSPLGLSSFLCWSLDINSGY